MRDRLWRTRCDGMLWRTLVVCEAGNVLDFGSRQGALRLFVARNHTRRAMRTMTQAGGRCHPRECIRVGVSAGVVLMHESSTGAHAADSDELKLAWP